MLYFRFDCEKENFKGIDHKSVLYGHNAEEMAIFEFENENVTMILQKGYSFVNYNKNVLTKDKIIYNIYTQFKEMKMLVNLLN